MVTKDSLCNHIVSLFRDFVDFGCCVESPVVESDVCYTSTNFLAEYVTRNVCFQTSIADKLKAFLSRYQTDFYDYYQILLRKPFTLPFTAVEHVQVDTVDNIRVVHVRRTNIVIDDYYNYANLVSYKAVYHIIYSDWENALRELRTLDGLFDGYGFADNYYKTHGYYETYKLALAVIVYKCISRNASSKYVEALASIEPFATLYTVTDGKLTGTGDLNLESATLSLIALYDDNICNYILPQPQLQTTTVTTTYEHTVTQVLPLLAVPLALIPLIKLLNKVSSRR